MATVIPETYPCSLGTYTVVTTNNSRSESSSKNAGVKVELTLNDSVYKSYLGNPTNDCRTVRTMISRVLSSDEIVYEVSRGTQSRLKLDSYTFTAREMHLFPKGKA